MKFPSPSSDNAPTTPAFLAFSPDGTGVAYSSFRGPETGTRRCCSVHLADLSTGTQKLMFETYQMPAYDTIPSFSLSPDGTTAVFTAPVGPIRLPNGKYSSSQWELFMTQSNSGGRARLTNDNDWDGYPVFTPDGKYIVFLSTGKGGAGLIIMGPDGKNRRTIAELHTYSEQQGVNFTISRDGKKVAFEDFSSSTSRDIFVVNLDGTGRTRLRDIVVEH
jgi:Tol biopolymer transport system component